MTLKILIVDDSSFFQRQLKNIIDSHPNLTVIGTADNGRDAIEKVKSLKPDLVTMDYEMPMMDGVSAVRAIMSENPLPILMLSSMTFEGARITLDALDAGAVDFMTKNFSEISKNGPEIRKRIHDTLLALGSKILDKKPQSFDKPKSTAPSNLRETAAEEIRKKMDSAPTAETILKSTTIASHKSKTAFPTAGQIKLIAIGASTGGPQVLSDLLKKLPASFSIPIVIVQHMPESFTSVFSERLNAQCPLEIKEAQTGDELKPGRVLLAPGGKQMIVNQNDIRTVKIIDSSKEVNYKPSVDITFASLSNTYKSKTLGVVLTGMGSDGCDGAQLLKNVGANIWTQSKDDCLIYGMPMAIDKANLSDASLDMAGIKDKLMAL